MAVHICRPHHHHHHHDHHTTHMMLEIYGQYLIVECGIYLSAVMLDQCIPTEMYMEPSLCMYLHTISHESSSSSACSFHFNSMHLLVYKSLFHTHTSCCNLYLKRRCLRRHIIIICVFCMDLQRNYILRCNEAIKIYTRMKQQKHKNIL